MKDIIFFVIILVLFLIFDPFYNNVIFFKGTWSWIVPYLKSRNDIPNLKTPQPLRITLVWINYYRSLYNSPKKSFLSDLFPLLGHNGLHFAFFVLDAFPTLFKLQSNAIQLGGHGIWKMEEKKSLNDWIYICEPCVLTRKINRYIQLPARSQFTSRIKGKGNWCVCGVVQASIERY